MQNEHIYQIPDVAVMGEKDLWSYWHAIVECKKKFLNGAIDPSNISVLHSEIAESWLRSKEFGINPSRKLDMKFLKGMQLEKTLKENEELIHVTKHILSEIKMKEVMRKNYAFYLFDKYGILLYMDGDKGAVGSSAKIGSIWREETVGTNAHILSIRSNRPYTIIGPEHFCEIFQNSIVTAAPIHDSKGQVMAALVLGVHLYENSLSIFFHMRDTIGLINAIAVAVQNRLELLKSYTQLQIAHNMQSATMSLIDEGMITIDEQGRVLQATKEAARMLHTDNEYLHELNIRDIFSDKVWHHVSNGLSVDLEETIYVDNNRLPLVLNIRPIFNETVANNVGAVIRFKPKEKTRLMSRVEKINSTEFTFKNIIGQSKAMKDSINLARRFAASTENILLTGESGTGKEIFAQAIHNEYCPTGPFIACNCAAMPRELVVSELFGYEGGSFTGADRHGRPGKIELANGGTLFLDEIGDMPLELQAVLLRVLEDKRVTRVGGQRDKKVNFRLIAATNKNLSDMVKEKRFREDLFFRLSVLTITLPPLREREEDVVLLAKHFINEYCSKMNKKTISISPEVEKVFREYTWPGNVRQLKNAVVYALNITRSDTLKVNDLPPFLFRRETAKADLRETCEMGNMYNIEEMEKVLIENALYRSRGNITKAAEMLGIAKSTLYRKMKDYNINIQALM